MDAKEGALAGALGGAAETLVLSGLHEALSKTGLVFETGPMPVVDRAEELNLAGDLSPGSRRALTAFAHLAYGVEVAMALGLLRREIGGSGLGTCRGLRVRALGLGARWSGWLPLTGVHAPPWRQQTTKVLLPVVDHAAYGAAWVSLTGR